MASDAASEMSLQACELEMEGENEKAAEIHFNAASEAPKNPEVQAAFASHFIREQLPSVQGDEGLAQMVAAAFDVAIAAGSVPHAEYAVFLWQVVQDPEQAQAAFDAAIAASPDDVELRYNYGNFLDQGLGEQARAASEYELVLSSNATHFNTLNNYAALLVEQSRGMRDDDDDVLGKAQDLLVRAQEICPGAPAYNLACIAARLKTQTECEHWLRLAYSEESAFQGLPDAEDLLGDDDLESIREEAWFQRLLDEVTKAQEAGVPLPAPEDELV